VDLALERLPLAKLGEIGQMGFVCEDLVGAVDFWTRRIGAGPFYELSHIKLSGTRYRGAAAEVDLSAALGYFGDLQIELIQQHCESPSVYREWLAQGGTGVQHVAVLVDDFEAAHRALLEIGGEAVQETEIPGSVRCAYFHIPGNPPVLEILQLSEAFARQWRQMRAAARGWNGERPLRSINELQ
jgi:catechol 2,3-dioxygenase-like lactoylglutathione lyase family enzyme